MSTFPVALRGASADTLMWAQEDQIEPAALARLRTISSLPWVRGLRVMADAHLGKGATAGSVIAAQSDLVEIVAKLQTVLCVKG